MLATAGKRNDVINVHLLAEFGQVEDGAWGDDLFDCDGAGVDRTYRWVIGLS
jgi:hypothetical protein